MFLNTKAQQLLVPIDRINLETEANKLMEDDLEYALAVLKKWSANYQLSKQDDLEHLSKVFLARAYVESDKTEEAVEILNKLLSNSDPYSEAMALKTLASIDFKNGRFFASTVKSVLQWILLKAIMKKC